MTKLLKVDALRTIVAELFIKKIGVLINDKSLEKFDLSNSTPRVYFLGYNRATDCLHWVLINDKYKITKKLSTNDQILLNPDGKDEISREKIRDYFQKVSGDRLLSDPTLLFESPTKPQSYGKETVKKVKIVDNNDHSLNPNLYKDRLGLSMLAFDQNSAQFSPFAILDPRSYLPGIWDIVLGIETTLYLPIYKEPTPTGRVGVLVISWDYEQLKVIPPSIKFTYRHTRDEVVDMISIDDLSRTVKKLYWGFTEDEADKISPSLQTWWVSRLKEPDIIQKIEMLEALLEVSLDHSNTYVFNFDNYVIEKNIEINPDLKLANTLKQIGSLEHHSTEQIEEYIKESGIPTFKYIENLRRVEPLLQNIGKREHYIHMFNVFLMGRVFLKFLFGFDTDSDNPEKWKIISLSHDIAYPVETIEDELEEFFEVYFHNKMTPRVSISRELFFSYRAFNEIFYKLMEKSVSAFDSLEVSCSDRYRRDILEDLVLYNFYKRADHAVISSLFTAKACMDHEKVELRDSCIDVAVPILLHNFYQWKHHALTELDDALKTLNSDNRGKFVKDNSNKIGFSKLTFPVFLYDRYRGKFPAKFKIIQFKRYIKQYRDKLDALAIKIAKGDSDLKKFIFTLALADLLQEWGRITYVDKGKASLGIRVQDMADNELQLVIPLIQNFQYVYSKKGHWYFKVKSSGSDKLLDNMTEDKLRIVISELPQDTDAGDKSEKAQEAIIRQNILKFLDFTKKFSYTPTGRTGKRGLFAFAKPFFSISWHGISQKSDDYVEFRWPK